jgi:hypothetical protein
VPLPNRNLSREYLPNYLLMHRYRISYPYCTLTCRIGIGCQLINTIPADEDKLVDLNLPEWTGLIRSQRGK